MQNPLRWGEEGGSQFCWVGEHRVAAGSLLSLQEPSGVQVHPPQPGSYMLPRGSKGDLA